MADLNQKHIDGLKHSLDERIYSRTERGLKLVLARKPSKLRSWELTYYLFGKKTRYVFGHYPTDYTLADARIERDRLKSLVRKGICPKTEAEREVNEKKLDLLKSITFADLRDRFDNEHLKKRKRKSRHETIRVLRKEFASWDSIEPNSINKLMIEGRLNAIEKRGAVMRNRAHSYLRSMLQFGVKKSIVVTNNASGLERAPEKPRTRALSPEEVRYFWKNIERQSISEQTAIALKLILVTGQRGGEIVSMENAHVSGDWWTQPDTKNGRIHKTFLTPTAQQLIQRAQECSPNSTFIFGTKTGHIQPNTLSKAILRWKQNSDNPMSIPAFTPHDLRRTMTTNLGNMEVERFAQNQILNHADNSIGGVYDLSEYDALKRRTMPLWESRLCSIIENAEVDNVFAITA